jgi:ribonuclease-3
VDETGPDHDKQFCVELTLNDAVIGMGIGTSKKRAEQDAARVALENMK